MTIFPDLVVVGHPVTDVRREAALHRVRGSTPGCSSCSAHSVAEVADRGHAEPVQVCPGFGGIALEVAVERLLDAARGRARRPVSQNDPCRCSRTRSSRAISMVILRMSSLCSGEGRSSGLDELLMRLQPGDMGIVERPRSGPGRSRSPSSRSSSNDSTRLERQSVDKVEIDAGEAELPRPVVAHCRDIDSGCTRLTASCTARLKSCTPMLIRLNPASRRATRCSRVSSRGSISTLISASGATRNDDRI